GIDHPMVHGVQTLDDAARLLDAIAGGAGGGSPVRRAVVVGGGYIGLELAEAFVMRGMEVTLVEAADQVMSTLDADVAAPLLEAMDGIGIRVRLRTPLEAVEDGAVVAGGERIPAEVVVLGLGVRPASELAVQAGIEVGDRRGIRVDRRQ